MAGLTVRNFIMINGEAVDMDTLPQEKRADISRQLQIQFMKTAGYRVKEEPDEKGTRTA